MGLLSHITEGRNKKKDSGLLFKAKKFNSHKNSFQSWARSYGFNNCALFMNVGEMLLMCHAYGVNAEIIAKSISSQDFWNGLNLEQGFNSFTKDDSIFTSLLQFFSFEEKSLIQNIALMRIEEDDVFYILFIFSTTKINLPIQTEDFIPSLISSINSKKNLQDAVDELSNRKKETLPYFKNLEARLYFVSLKDAISISIKSAQIPEYRIMSAARNTIFEELFYETKMAFPFPNCISCSNTDEIKLMLFINSESDSRLIKAELALIYEGILGSNGSNAILLLKSGSATTIEGAQEFLCKGDYGIY